MAVVQRARADLLEQYGGDPEEVAQLREQAEYVEDGMDKLAAAAPPELQRIEAEARARGREEGLRRTREWVAEVAEMAVCISRTRRSVSPRSRECRPGVRRRRGIRRRSTSRDGPSELDPPDPASRRRGSA